MCGSAGFPARGWTSSLVREEGHLSRKSNERNPKWVLPYGENPWGRSPCAATVGRVVDAWTIDVPGERVLVRELGPAEEAPLLRLFEECEDWFVAATGLPSGPGDVRGLFCALPEGASPDDKVLLVLERDGVVAGVVDAVR